MTIDLRGDRDLVQDRHAAQLRDRRFHEVADVDGSNLKLDLSRLDLLQVENVVDEPDQPIGVLSRNAGEVARFRRQLANGAGLHETERSANRRQRRPQLVRDDRHELALDSIELLPLGDVAHDAAEGGPVAIADTLDGDLDVEGRAVATSAPHVVRLLGNEADLSSHRLARLGRDEVEQRPARDLRKVVAEETPERHCSLRRRDRRRGS